MANISDETKAKIHGLADHQFGDELNHRHDETSDHDHDDFEGDGRVEENPLWIQDHVTLTSVGIDIGSSGTQVIFSKINLRRLSEELTSRYYVVSRETLFLSPVSLTPYQSDTRIDDAALKEIVAAAYENAGIAPADIDTGASRVSSETGKRILNLDIGGGTTKLAVVEAGKVIATAAIHIGGRLQVVDAEGRIARLDPAGKTHARRARFNWTIGDLVGDDDLNRLAEVMADTLVSALCPAPSADAA